MHLPKADGEYYQFVYFNDKGKMCGASSPFYFMNPRHEDDLVEETMSDDADMLYITTKRGQLAQKTKECEQLTEVCLVRWDFWNSLLICKGADIKVNFVDWNYTVKQVE